MRLEGDWSRLRNNLHRLVGMNFTTLHKEIGEYLVSRTQERFDTETAPDGTRWPVSHRAREEGGQTLRDTSRLRNSINYAASANRVEVGTNVRYAGVHQEGARIRPRRARYLRFKIGDRWARKREVEIPARQFLGINDEDVREIDGIIKDTLEDLLR